MSDASKASVLLVGTGVVGSAILSILEGGKERGEGVSGIALAAVANTRGVVPVGDAALDPAAIGELLARPRSGEDGTRTIGDDVLDAHARRPSPVLVDATAADGMESLYERALERGIHVVTANKKPLAASWSARLRLSEVARKAAAGERRTKLRYEATVGAGLPVIETVKDLVRTGDRVRRIECVLSGTLGFLANELHAGARLSEAVAVAKDRGFTEPDPREDLGGADVARKACILARELGAPLDVTDVDLTPFVPSEALAGEGLDALFVRLRRLDDETSSRIERLKARGQKLVYLARIEVAADGVVSATAGPTIVSNDHPAASLGGSSALVAFTTARYDKDPLVVRGSGAGGAVTASAVLADVLKATGQT